jgi:hypothetical protein
LFALHLNGPSSQAPNIIKKRALELGRTSVRWQTHPCPGHTHQVLWGAVYPSSHMVEAPHHIWGGEAGSSSSPHMNEERVVIV